ncbi:DUF262 domain-containing protein [Paenibacillus zeisoli]|uniref:DUF262 domain-containing protein n=1 Tax=Paenibacillus zeisoli TaxID=2496267 RepID=A0A433X942_9BACL|nr:DUF262 domain-containing protein [Paenibacillus zeisoli]RUT30488.1 DUF262 domain-containing protein [Paenibacillus zeisoli]
MSYTATAINEVVRQIGNNEIYLPAIQRKFVWTYEQIEKLFDSIMLGYPIGTFLFWKVEKSKTNDYIFYKFIQDYHERDRYHNDMAPKPEMKEWIIGVLDGQQRLSSLYLALQGSYAYKKPKARWDNDDAFPKRQLYLNVLYKNKPRDEDANTYEFKFLTEAESKLNDSTHFWLAVKESLNWNDANGYIKFANKNNLLSSTIAIENLTLLWQRITQDKVINYFEVKAQELDDVLDIFTRVNSGGTVLSKSDLLFSTIVASWEQAREEIEQLLKQINNKGDKFDFDNDFIMRACLFLTDSPVLFNVKNFKRENVQKVKDNWEGIKNAIKRTIELLVEFGFSQESLTSKNAIIPISYYIFKGGKLENEDKKNIKHYLITSLLKFIYGGKGDQVLEAIRSGMRVIDSGTYKLKSENFPLTALRLMKLPGEKSLQFTVDDIENLFDYKKGAYTFMVLSLLYPHLKLGQIKFHQDHLHPASSFTQTKLKQLKKPESSWRKWIEKKDTIPNLQLLEGLENETKNKSQFKDWVEKEVTTNPNYKSLNYIPNVSLELDNFEQFYESRKQMIISKLKEIMDIR